LTLIQKPIILTLITSALYYDKAKAYEVDHMLLLNLLNSRKNHYHHT